MAGQAASVTKRSHKGLIATLIVLGVLVLLAVAAFLMGNFYFANRAPLGTSFAGQSVAGKSEAELTELVTSKVDDTKFVLGTAEGKSTEATYKDLGVTADVKETVASLLNARGDNAFAKVNPFGGTSVALAAKTDTATMQSYLDSTLVDEGSQVVLPTIAYNKVTKSFLTTPGKDGHAVTADSVEKAVATSLTSQTSASAPVKATVKLVSETTPITAAAAQTAADAANKRLLHTYSVTNGSSKTYTIPAAEVATWIKASPDIKTGAITVSYDTAAIKNYMETTLPDKLKQDKVDQENLVTPSGQKLLVKTAGADGVEVKDVSSAVTEVTSALEKGTDVTAKVTTAVTKHTTKNVKVPDDYDKANGSKWVKVNLSTETVTAYKGTTVVKTFNMASGKYTADGSRVSDNGTFYVYLKYATQTMRGADYVTPGVQWVSYYNGGEGFHGAPWNTYNISRGYASSHGCINMNVSDAKWIYDWAVIGTKVEVVGSTSASPVRVSGASATTTKSNTSKTAKVTASSSK
jgi:lipoprotein-anchoring transpeptidase ErfK/SrfK